MTRRRIWHIDAFTTEPLAGNPAAVVDGDGLDPATMQRIALNQKLSETVFLLPPESGGAHARLRIFTPAAELPFAGHPIVAAAHAIVEEGLVPRAEGAALRLETGAGVIPVDVTAGPPARYTMTQAAPSFRPVDVSVAAVAAAVGLGERDIVRLEYVSTGLEWLIAQVAPDAMARVAPDAPALRTLMLAVFCVDAGRAEAPVRVRAFPVAQGIAEDPVTGSANGCIAALIARDRLLPAPGGEIAYVAEQGLEMGQPGRVYASVAAGDGAPRVRIGGHAVTVLRGDLLLDGA